MAKRLLLLFLILSIVLAGLIFFGLWAWNKYQKQIHPALDSLGISYNHNAMEIDPEEGLREDPETGYLYGSGYLLEKTEGSVAIEFIGGEQRSLILDLMTMPLVADRKDYEGQEKVERFKNIDPSEKVFVVFSPSSKITFMRVLIK